MNWFSRRTHALAVSISLSEFDRHDNQFPAIPQRIDFQPDAREIPADSFRLCARRMLPVLVASAFYLRALGAAGYVQTDRRGFWNVLGSLMRCKDCWLSLHCEVSVFSVVLVFVDFLSGAITWRNRNRNRNRKSGIFSFLFSLLQWFWAVVTWDEQGDSVAVSHNLQCVLDTAWKCRKQFR